MNRPVIASHPASVVTPKTAPRSLHNGQNHRAGGVGNEVYIENENCGDIAEIWRLWEMGLSQREIANSVKCGKTTVGEIQHRCMDVGLTLILSDEYTRNQAAYVA